MMDEKTVENVAKIPAFLNKEKLVGKLVQIVIGLTLSVIFYIIMLLVMRTDSFSSAADIEVKTKQSVTILDGTADSSALSVVDFNTILPYVRNYMPINYSMNLKGGAQFTYVFWLNVADRNAVGLVNKPIFLRGDKKKYNYSKNENGTLVDVSNDFLVFCPLITFGNDPLEFRVKFNTGDKIIEEMYIKRIASNNELLRKNIMSVLQSSWIMISIVFEDNIPINDFENGIRVRFYLNDNLHDTGYFSGYLKQNQGNLFFFPEGSLSGVRLSNMTYFNYALNAVEIRKMYDTRPSNKMASTINASISNSVSISDRNILDIYNI